MVFMVSMVVYKQNQYLTGHHQGKFNGGRWWRPDENGVYTWVFQNIKKQVKAEVIKRLDEGASQKDIAAELNITAARVSQLKKEAVRDGLITEAGKLIQTGFEWTQNK